MELGICLSFVKTSEFSGGLNTPPRYANDHICIHTGVQVKSKFLHSLSFHSHKKKYGTCLKKAIIYLFFLLVYNICLKLHNLKMHELQNVCVSFPCPI
jgi:hypothetical protein